MTSALAPLVPGTNRRAACRFDVKVPLEYCVSDRPRPGCKLGNSINVCSSGVLITTEECLSMGSVLEIAMNWPSALQGKSTVRLFMIGCVVRVGGGITALRIGRHEFRVVRLDSDSTTTLALGPRFHLYPEIFRRLLTEL